MTDLDFRARQATDAATSESWARGVCDELERGSNTLARPMAADVKTMLAGLPDDVRPGVLDRIDAHLRTRAPDIARKARALLGIEKPPPPQIELDCTDAANAERLAERYGHKLRYVTGWGWTFYDGRRWKRDDSGEAVRLALETARSRYDDAIVAYGLNDVARAQRLGKWAATSLSASRIGAMLELAQAHEALRVAVSDFDASPWLFNVRNGVIDLKTGELLAHRPDDHISHIADVDYDPAASCDRWLGFLERIFDGRYSLIDFVQRAVGYSLTGLTTEQVLFLCIGTGANGKSTFLNALRALFGTFGQQADFTTFLVRPGDGPRNDIARMAGARFVSAVEAGQDRKLSEPIIKQLTGGDPVTARHLYGEFFEFTPQFKLWMGANHKPTIRETAEAIWRRIRLIPFDVTIPQAERDPGLGDKLRAELPGILAWAVQGGLQWQREGLQAPEAVSKATATYRAEQDAFAAFLSDCCVIGPDRWATAGDLHRAYTRWGGEDNAKAFGIKLRERGFPPDKATGGIRIWRGLGLLKIDDNASGG